MSTTNRSALITGSGKNIGRSIALDLANRGFNIVINGSTDEKACLSVADDIKSAGGNAIVAMGDIGNRENIQAIVNIANDAFGGIDMLVNNAAIRPSFNFLEGSEDEWNRILNVNFNSCFWLCRATLPAMVKNNWGRVIFFTGMNAQQGYPGKSAVSVSKHANWGLSKSIAKEFGPMGITSNIISPGTIVADTENADENEKYIALKKNNPAGRLGAPTDIAATVGFLSSDEAGFINGQLIQVNGGVVQ